MSSPQAPILADSSSHTHLIPQHNPAQPFYIGFGAIGGAEVGRKGFNELKTALESLPQTLKSRCKLLVFGGNAPQIEGIAMQILGFLHDDSTLALAYNACDVFVTPSLAENLSNAIMESLSCGTPVVCFDIGGNGDMLSHKHNGYLAKDVQDLRAGIKWIASLAPSAYSQIASQARQSVLEKFESAKIATLYAKTYEQLTGGGQTQIVDKTKAQDNPPFKPLLIIAVPSEESFIRYAVNGILNMPPHHISRFTDKTLHKIAEIFNLELLEIYHEQVQPEHIQFYKGVMWAKSLLPTPLVDRGLWRKIINRLGFVGRRLIKVPANAYGHTAVAVYRLK